MLNDRIAIGAVLLAAGSGSRMGYRPKSLLQLDGVPLICRQLIALSGAGVDEVVVVLGHHAELIEPVIKDFAVTVVRNMHPDDGQVSSQRLGIAAFAARLDACLVALADQPLIDSHDISDLIAAYRKRPGDTSVVVPQVQGKRGNPVMFSDDVRQAVLQSPVHVGCRQWQESHPKAVHYFVSDTRNYRIDLDTPDDVEQFTRDTGQLLHWHETVPIPQEKPDA